MVCKHHGKCLNNNICHLCTSKRLLKFPAWMRKKEKNKTSKKKYKSKKKGMNFEKRVKNIYDEYMSDIDNTKTFRPPNSGGIWSMPGDITTSDEIFECKERATKANAVNKIAIPKSDLLKTKEEAISSGKLFWYYVFGFKNENGIFLVKEYDSELLLHESLNLIEDLQGKITNNLNIKAENIKESGEGYITFYLEELDDMWSKSSDWRYYFKYKNDDRIYLIKPYENELELLRYFKNVKK